MLVTVSDKKLAVPIFCDPTIDRNCVPNTIVGAYYKADVITAVDYYPFGMTMPGRKFTLGEYRYGFNGKEKLNEISGEGNSYDYGARVNDTRLGRWFAVDAKDKPWISPYNFVSNSPTNRIDPDGKDDIHFYFITTTTVKTYGIGVNARTVSLRQTIAVVEIEKTNGPDKFYHHRSSIVIDPAFGGNSYSDKKTEFFPFDLDSRSGLTTTTMPFSLGLYERDDRDVHTLSKYYDQFSAFKEYLDKRLKDPRVKWSENGKNYKNIFFPNRANFKFWGTVSSYSETIANCLMVVRMGVGLFLKGGSVTSFCVASSEGGAVSQMQLVRIIKKGEKLDDIINEGKALTWTTGNEHALVKLANGERALVSGGPGGISFQEGQIQKLFGHTHPTSAPPSSADFEATKLLGQTKQYVLHGGETTVVKPIK